MLIKTTLIFLLHQEKNFFDKKHKSKKKGLQTYEYINTVLK